MGEEVVLELTQALAGSFAEVYFDNFFNSPKLIDKSSKGEHIQQAQCAAIEKICLDCQRITKWREGTVNSCFQTTSQQ